MLDLSYKIEPDGFRVFDGRDLARALIKDAYKLLLPYVDNCPACGDNLFSVIANAAIEEIHREKDGGIMMMAPPEDAEAKRRHVAAGIERTRELLAHSPRHRHE